jgi:cytochrome c oxidase subunit 1
VVAPGTIFAMFAGIYHWYPKVTGRTLNETLGKIHFWASLVFMNGVFMPMMFEGMAGVSRRMPDPTVYATGEAVHGLTKMSSYAAWCLALAQIPFIINFFWSMRKQERAEENPWQATTLEWATPTPPPHGNFTEPPVVYRGPYEYSVPGTSRDFVPQYVKQPV